MALVAVALLFATGVVPTAALGLYHVKWVRPALERGTPPERLRGTARVDLAFGLLVLSVTAIDPRTPPR